MATIIAEIDAVDEARGGTNNLSFLRNKLAEHAPGIPAGGDLESLALDGNDVIFTLLDKSTVTFGFNDDMINDLHALLSDSSSIAQTQGTTGYEFTGGFAERTTGSAGSNALGTNVQYTSEQAAAKTWKRFGFSTAQQVINDNEYWGETDPAFDQSKGLFGGIHMPPGIQNLFAFGDTDLSAAVTTGDLQYTAAEGSYDLTECQIGDLVKVRFSFNAVPQVANSTLEVGLIFATRDADDNVTFTFPLTTQPIYYGTGTQGEAFLNRVEMSAYIASSEDLNARLLPAIRCNNEILIQPISTLITIIR